MSDEATRVDKPDPEDETTTVRSPRPHAGP